MKSFILLENVVFYAYHGVQPHETTVGNEFVINLKLEVNLTDGSAEIKDSSTTHQTDTLANIENIIGTSGADTFVGDSENNSFDGRSSNDTISYSNVTSSTAITIDLKNDQDKALDDFYSNVTKTR